MQAGQAITTEQEATATSEGLSVPVIARDVATLGSGTLLAAVFSTLLIFLIPRLISVEDYGYWRLFTLYASYVGFLHIGFADGALLRWAGRPLEEFHHEIAPSIKFLVCQQLAVILPACLAAALLLPAQLRFIGATVLAFALIVNPVTVLQYSLQGARLFKPVAIAAAAPAGAFVVLVFLWDLRGVPTFRGLIGLYFVAWAGVLVYLWARVRPLRASASLDSAWGLGKRYMLLGWPILLANLSYLLEQSADRLVVSSALPIRDFAEYSLAASTMFVPITAIAAVYRVFFSHVAALEQAGRAKAYAHTSKFLLIAWSLLLPYYFVLEVFIRYFLPNYVPALPTAGILLLGVIFLAGIQVLHMSYFYLSGRQRGFLAQAIAALVVSFSLALATAVWLRSLAAVAVGQVVALAFWWLINEWKLREASGQGFKDWLRILVVFAWSAIGYGLAVWCTRSVGWRIALFYILLVPILADAFPEEFRLGWRLLRSGASGPP